MRRLHYFQVPCDVSCQVRSPRVLSMLLCTVLRQHRWYCHDEAGRPEAVCAADWPAADSDSPCHKNRLPQVLCILVTLLSVAALTTWQATKLVAAPSEQYLGWS